MDDDGSVLDPAITRYVPMSDPKPSPEGEPCQLWLVTCGEFRNGFTDTEMASRPEAQEACDPFNLRMGFSSEEPDRIIFACMTGGTA